MKWADTVMEAGEAVALVMPQIMAHFAYLLARSVNREALGILDLPMFVLMIAHTGSFEKARVLTRYDNFGDNHEEYAMSYQTLEMRMDGAVAIVTLNRAERRNALDEQAVAEIEHCFSAPPAEARVIVLAAKGPHFCAGLDLKEHHLKQRSPAEFMRVCQGWHRAFDRIQHGGIPVVAALQGAVVGGGLELASAAHVRVGDATTYFALPEGQWGIFTGGGATVRTARLVTPNRMVEMMLTGRVMNGDEGLQSGLLNYLTEPGRAFDQAMSLARKIAENAPLSNYSIVAGINKIWDMSATDGLFTESLLAALVQTSPEVQTRLREFVEKRAAKVAV
jgi:enoyl-CoA hydratase/carnithine racemase